MALIFKNLRTRGTTVDEHRSITKTHAATLKQFKKCTRDFEASPFVLIFFAKIQKVS